MSARCQLCLTVDIAAAAAKLPEILAAALDSTSVSSLTLRAARGVTFSAAAAIPLVQLAQRKSVAALIADDCDLARIVKADGVHVSWSKDIVGAYRAARESLGERFIVGADAGRSRHDAMTLGESGADYVAFGIPPHVEDRATAEERQIDLIAWWSDIFEVPCVAFDVAEPGHAEHLAAADFIAVTLPANLDAQSTATWLSPFAAAIIASGKAA